LRVADSESHICMRHVRGAVEKGGTVPHTALIYADRRDRDRLIESCVEIADADWRPMTVLSAQPEDDSRSFGSMMRRHRGGGKESLSVIDVRRVLAEKRNPARGIRSLLSDARRSGKGARSPLIVGDWTHRVYDTFQTALQVEEAEERTSNLVCCYRGEGFWSLNTGSIATIFELHRRVLFGSTVFGKEDSAARPHSGR
jgi:hypothetical protein